MEFLAGVAAYVAEHREALLGAVRTHVLLSAAALALAALPALPLGVAAARGRAAAALVTAGAGVFRVVPSLAILVLILPYLGLGFAPALVALTLLAAPPILLNTAAAYGGVDAAVLEAARGMGLSARQVFWTIETPLALPVVVAGLRTAAVEVVASATLAAFIGGGGLGEFIVNGLGMSDWRALLAGALPVAALALLVEGCFAAGERIARTLTA